MSVERLVSSPSLSSTLLIIWTTLSTALIILPVNPLIE